MKISLIFKQLKSYGIKPSKRLGQNFLIDKNILKKIINVAELKKSDIVLEIGPGLGGLTIELAQRVKKIIAVEKDKRMCEILKKNIKNYENIKIINQDILKFSSYPKSYKLIANLPYYITSPVIRKFLEVKNKPKTMIVMVQKEVAQRIIAKPPKMNLLAIAVQFYGQPEIVSYVSKKCFYPVPKVDSAIIKIKPKSKLKLSETDTEEFFKLIKSGFSSKRKMLVNNLKIQGIILEQIGINPKVRAENLSIQDWLSIFHKLNFS